MSSLTSRLLKTVKKSGIGETMKNSEFSKIDYYVQSDSIIVNLLLSSKWNGGIPSGKITMLAGPKSHGKTMLAMNLAKKFQQDGGTIILFDSEFASESTALENLGLDTDNIIYMPLSHIKDEDKEQSMTYQVNELFKQIERGDKVMFIFDSMGAWQTKSTLANIDKNNTAMDMKISQDKKGFMSMLAALTGQKGVPTIVLNHSYEAIGSFTGGQEVAGGGANYYPSTILLLSSKSQFKLDGSTDVSGSGIRTSVYKGRLSREKAVAKWVMHYEHNILPFYGLNVFALEGGFIEETKDGRSTVYMFKSGDKEFKAPKKTYMLPECNEFWIELLKTTDFGDYLNDIFAYGSNKQIKALEVEE